MNGFANHGLDEASFDEKKGLTEGLRTFDAFPKTKTTYTTRHARGGQWTVILLLTCALLSLSELRRWYRGHETHQFSVEKGVGHALQINLDMVVAMHCHDLHVNVQDAAGDLILAGQMLKKDDTSWAQWKDGKGVHPFDGAADAAAAAAAAAHHDESDHVGDVLGSVAGAAGGGVGGKKFKKTPRLRKGAKGDACRIYGSMELNKVQGDFHITARGHGYMEFAPHLDHSAFNFSHIITELSFGPYYPSLHNPLDATIATTSAHFYKFQYYVSVVPTVYTSSRARSVATNQYAVTSQSRQIGERSVPGVFFKYDIEPILLLVADQRRGFLRLLLRIVNVVSGVLVAGGWCYQLLDWAAGVLLGRRRRAGGKSEGVLNGRVGFQDEDGGEEE